MWRVGLSVLIMGGSALYAICPSSFGLAGGSLEDAAVAYFLQGNGSASPLMLNAPGGSILSVDMNGNSVGLIGGTDGLGAIAYLIFPSGKLSSSLISTVGGSIYGVGMNELGLGLIGGSNGMNAVAYTVTDQGAISSNLMPSIIGQVNAVTLNELPMGFIVGTDVNNGAFAYQLNTAGLLTPVAIPAFAGSSFLTTAINSSGAGLVGGYDSNPNPGAYLISPTGVPSANLLGLTGGRTNSVAINDSQLGLIGGYDSTGAFAYLVQSNGSLSAPLLPSLPNSEVSRVALNNQGVGLMGGGGVINPPFAYFVLPDGTTSAQILPDLTVGSVTAVAINEFNTGLIVGNNSFLSESFGYVAYLDGTVIPLEFPTGSPLVNAGALIQALTQIPTSCLKGNLKTMADYINQYAPQKAAYFLPALVNGSLYQAMQGVAPMRNAFALVTADQNMFTLNESLSRHLRDHRLFRRRLQEPEPTTSWMPQEDGLLVDNSDQTMRGEWAGTKPWQSACWINIIGELAHQKKQKESQAFDPIMGGFIAALETMRGSWSQAGIGAAYTYTDIHEEQGAGHSTMHQPYLFAYGLFGNRKAYLDLALWSGLFYIHHQRNIHLTGFDSIATSNPHGWQLSPHMEVGKELDYVHPQVLLEPFLMLDWANAWQKRYREQGSGLFNIGQKEHYSSLLRTEVGFRVYETLIFKTWGLTFQEKLSYVNKTSFGAGRVEAFLIGSPGSFTLETLSESQNIGVGELAMIFQPNHEHAPYACFSYQGEFSVPYQSHRVLFEMCWGF